jgi:hypothetical protein
MSDDKYKIMLSGYIDDELTPDEKREFEAYLKTDAELQKEYETFRKLKEVTGAMKYADIPEVVWENYWARLYRKLERGLGWIFISAGAIILLAFGCYHLVQDFFFDPKQSLVLKIAIGSGLLGVIILLVSVIRERVFAAVRDRYDEVQR